MFGAGSIFESLRGGTNIPQIEPEELSERFQEACTKIRKECGTGKWEPNDGATSAAWVAYQCMENAMIFPITPSTLMAEMADTWSTSKITNAFDQVPKVTQMQSEAGAAGAVHGAVSVGGLATTFTASQGLLLMLPNMIKMAGELCPVVFHVPARAVAGQALSIFGDHNDIMQVRSTGFAFLVAEGVQSVLDFALVAHIAALRSRVPFVHAFDGFRISHEIQKIQSYPKAVYKKLMQLLAPEIDAHRARGLNPNHPHVQGTAQCEDIYFQAVESANKYFAKVPDYVEEAFAMIEILSGRKYKLFDYYGSKTAKYVIVIMGSGGGIVQEFLDKVNDAELGMVVVHLFRPWKASSFLSALPSKTLKAVAVCNKMKDPCSDGEPLYLDVCTSLQQAKCTVTCLNGRYGLSSKDFTPSMVAAIYKNLKSDNPKNPFTVGLDDDVTFYSLPLVPVCTVPSTTTQCIFWGFGSDGTVGANKNTIKIIAQNTQLYTQGYFAYDALKSGGVTISHLRFGPDPIRSSYLIDSGCRYLAMHKKEYIFCIQAHLILNPCAEGSTLVLNCPWKDEELSTILPAPFRKLIGQKKLKLFAIDANLVAKKTGMGKLINNIMTAVFFKLSGVLPTDQAMALLKDAVKKTYKSKGDTVVGKNITAVDAALSELRSVQYPADWESVDGSYDCYKKVRAVENVPAYVTDILDKVQWRQGGELKVSQLEPDGMVPMGHTQWAKRGVAECIPVVDMDKCIQCNICSAICPHAVIRPFLVSRNELRTMPAEFDTRKATGGNTYAGLHFRIQASPLDCTGCEVCTYACPTNALTMTSLGEALEKGHKKNWDSAMKIPDRGSRFDPFTLKGSQFQQPLLEFSGACEGCGETPYAKLLTQMFGKRMILANATGCSSIWGATAGWIPYTKDEKTGKGIAWGNSLFEDNAEFGLGQYHNVRGRRAQLFARVETALERCSEAMSPELKSNLEQWLESWDNGVLTEKLADELIPQLEAERNVSPEINEILRLKDLLMKPTMWMMGGDGWANDIGYGGIDHVLASGHKTRILVLDTEVYSNTGGQSSKATPMGAVAKFAQGGRDQTKKDLGGLFMAYGSIYVASCAIGANYKQTVQAFTEAEAFDGPAILMCYSPCIEHRTKTGLSQMSLDMKDAVECGYWPLYRYNPALAKENKNPFILDAKKLSGDVLKFLTKQNRYSQLARAAPELAEELQGKLESHLKKQHAAMRQRAEDLPSKGAAEQAESGTQHEPVTILFGSDTGVTEQVAKKFSGLCTERSLKVRKVCDLDEVSEMDDLKAICNGSIAVIMCSTCGHGDFPQNASLFWSGLSSTDLTNNELKGLKYCVFAMGDSSYHDSFCEAGKLIDARMSDLGAERLMDYGIGDDRDEDMWETGFNKWLPDFWTKINAPEPVDDGSPKQPLFSLELHCDSNLKPQKLCPPNATMLTLLENKRMTPDDYERDIRHVSLKTDNVDFPFDLGDAVAVYYENLPENVEEALQWFGLSGDDVYTVTCSENTSTRHQKAFEQRVTVRQIFTELLDIFGRPTKGFCVELARFAANAAEREKLCAMGKGGEAWKEVTEEILSFFGIFQKFPSAKPPLEQLMSMLPLSKPRLYSVASSPFYSENQFDLTIVIDQFKSSSGKKIKKGICTSYIQQAPVGSKIPCAAYCGTFKFPLEDTIPMVMVGLGTGIAPVRAFLQDKMYKKNQGIVSGPMVVFYGCRREKEELFYKEDWAYFKEQGVLTELVGAFQFDDPEKVVFVSHKMAERPELITKNLLTEKGFFYMCGPAVATPSVQKALKDAVSSEGGLGDEVETWFDEFMKVGRYSEESY